MTATNSNASAVHRSLTPAIVVGGNLNALGVVRSLARGGMPVFLLARRGDDIAGWSRHCHCEHVESYEGTILVAGLYQIRRRLDADPFLILTDEDAVRAVARHRDMLAKSFRFDIPSSKALRLLENKIDFHEFADREGFPLPASVAIREIDDIERLASLSGPLIIKPADKGAVRGKPIERATLIDRRETAIARCIELVASGAGAIVQEWIEGDDSALYFSLFYANSAGEPLVMFTGRKLAAYPPRVGTTAVCVPAPEAREALEPMARAMAMRAGMAGAGGLEFKWDAKRSRFVVIEPTIGRTDWQAEIATLAGVNIPLEGYRHATGEDTPRARRNENRVAWRVSAARRSARTPADAPVYDGYWRRDDPMPAYAYYIRRRLRGWTGLPRFRRPPVAIVSTCNGVEP